MKLVQVLTQSHYMHNPTSLRALFSLPGFVAASRLPGVFGNRYAGGWWYGAKNNSDLLAVWTPVPRTL